jgi:hypothetical protein
MKNITPQDGYIVFQKFFSDLVKRETTLVLWQLTSDGQRTVYDCVISSYKYDLGVLNFLDHLGQQLGLAATDVYCFVRSEAVIFKTRLRGQTVEMPGVLCFLEEPDIKVIKASSGIDLTDGFLRGRVTRTQKSQRDQDLFDDQLAQLTTSQEDKIYADQREAPRIRPKQDKLITCQRAGEPEMSQNFLLFDLSRGGLGFKIIEDGLFKRGEFVEITALEGQVLDQPLIGEVMSVRDLAPEDVGWKVGIRFVDEVPKL